MRAGRMAAGLAVVLFAGVALAQPPHGRGQGGQGGQQGQGGQGRQWQGGQPQAGQGHGGQRQQGGPPGRADQGRPGRGGAAAPAFADRDRSAIQLYFGQQIGAGNCPPGLAKKNNGCQPPGQARQWRIGQRLPAGVIGYPLPAELLLRLAPPAGHTYLRVGADILMIATGTGLVVAGLQDLLR